MTVNLTAPVFLAEAFARAASGGRRRQRRQYARPAHLAPDAELLLVPDLASRRSMQRPRRSRRRWRRASASTASRPGRRCPTSMPAMTGRFQRRSPRLPLGRGPDLADFGRTVRYFVENRSITGPGNRARRRRAYRVAPPETPAKRSARPWRNQHTPSIVTGCADEGRRRGHRRHRQAAAERPRRLSHDRRQGHRALRRQGAKPKKRVQSYARPAGQSGRIHRVIMATAAMEFVSTRTETEALLLEANLIKRLRPRFNVLLRDDKSFPYILITGDHPAPQIAKHRGARTRKGTYFGPFASAGAVGRTINALERAFLLRSCSDAVFESRTRPCLLLPDQALLGAVHRRDHLATPTPSLCDEAQDFLSGRSQAVRAEIQSSMEAAVGAARLRGRGALSRPPRRAVARHDASGHQSRRPSMRPTCLPCTRQGGQTCIEVFFFRTGQNWGNRAYFPRADKDFEPGRGARRLPCAVLRRSSRRRN